MVSVCQAMLKNRILLNNLLHSVPSCKKRSYKKRLVDMGEGKKRQLVGFGNVKKRFLILTVKNSKIIPHLKGLTQGI